MSFNSLFYDEAGWKTGVMISLVDLKWCALRKFLKVS
jgi:hypothetical protein